MKKNMYFRDRIIAIAIAGSLFLGCKTMYLERKQDFASFHDIQPFSEPLAVKLECEFYKQGKRKEASEKCLHSEVLSIFEATGAFSEATDSNNQKLPILTIVLKNKTVTENQNRAAASYYFLSVPSLGFIGTHLEQPASIDITLFWPDGSAFRREYPHTVHLYSGRHASPPASCEKLSKRDLAEELTEDVLLSFIRDFQENAK